MKNVFLYPGNHNDSLLKLLKLKLRTKQQNRAKNRAQNVKFEWVFCTNMLWWIKAAVGGKRGGGGGGKRGGGWGGGGGKGTIGRQALP